MKLSLITDPNKVSDEIKGETIHFGSPRLHQIFQSTKTLASYIRLYEKSPVIQGKQTPLKPWLGLNLKVSYQCDRKKDVFPFYRAQLNKWTNRRKFPRSPFTA